MELREGYKQTEVGVIPEDWTAVQLGDYVLKVGSGITPKGGSTVYKDFGRPFIRSQNVGWGELKLSDVAFIDEEVHASFSATEIKQNDVLLNITGASIGRSALVTKEIEGGNVNQHVCIIRTKESFLNSNFLCYVLLSDIGQKQIDSFQAGGNREGLNFGQIRSFLIPLSPTKPEQAAIANALSDADALIQSLTRLIAKKRQIKQGAMQQLLTGKIRLPGFGNAQLEFKKTEIGRLPLDWSLMEIKQVTRSHRQGYYTKDGYLPEGVKLVRITDLLNPRIDYASMPMLKLSANDHDRYRIHIGDFLFARSGAIGRYGIVYEDVDAVFGSYIIRFSFEPIRLQNEYFGYLYETEVVWKQLLSITQGSSNININATNIKSILVPLPPLKEQTHIANILSDMDAEINALETKLTKCQLIKQGMMQNLLTGRIRLI